MNLVSALISGICVVVALAGCQAQDDLWFEGDFEAAKAAAAAGQTLVMMDFYTDWCSWCKRLESDTFSKAEVRSELGALVAMRVNAEDGGEELAERYAIDGYPTMVFVNASGDEVDRLVGYFKPDKFVAEVRRIRAGDTFAACLSRLDEEPADLDALQRSVEGLLERSDPSGAVARVEAFHEASPDRHQDDCRSLMFRARAALQSRVYAKAAKIYRKASEEALEVPDTTGTARLRMVVESDFSPENPEEQVRLLRQARFEDAAELLGIVAEDRLSGDDLVNVADFAYANGHYDTSATLYRTWYENSDSDVGSSELNRIAWRMYLMGREAEVALLIARKAFAEDDSSDVADTVARLLYLTGSVDEAIALESDAAAAADDKAADGFREAIALMKEGADLGDRPGFEFYPGEREGSL